MARARTYGVLGNWKASEEAARDILQIDATDDYAANMLALTLHKEGRTKESRDVVSLLLQRIPEDPFGHANAGWTALQTGDHERALARFLISLSKDPNEQFALTGLRPALMQKAWLYRSLYQIRTIFWGLRPVTKIILLLTVFLCPLFIPILSENTVTAFVFSNLNVLLTLLLLPLALIYIERIAQLCILSHPLVIHSSTPLGAFLSFRWAR